MSLRSLRGLGALGAAFILSWLPAAVRAAEAEGAFDLVRSLERCDVVWTGPGRNSSDSMPLGNGDIALNVWTEPGGDLVFYIGKSDAWTENPSSIAGLGKLGRVRVSVRTAGAAPGAPIVQALRLHEGEIEIKEGAGASAVNYLVWVDANRPVIRLEVGTASRASVTVALEDWRTTGTKTLGADTIVPGQKDRIVWYHHNGPASDPHVRDWTFGAVIMGRGLESAGPLALHSTAAGTAQMISIYPLTTVASPATAWLTQVERQIAGMANLDLAVTRAEHRQWWDRFWRRSWIFLSGGGKAGATTEGYVLQRFVTACAGRGAYPIKFNGSLFVVDHGTANLGGPVGGPVTADERMWGGRYWFQNTRAMYWPRLAAGDFDEMLPLFRMYRAMLPGNAAMVRKYYHHDGAYSAEVSPFWGGLIDLSHDGIGYYGDDYFTDLLELSMMGLDYYEYTGDRAFLERTVLPIADGILTFFDQHFPRDPKGRLELDPDNALETYWKVNDPAPDIAGLHAILARLLALPEGSADGAARREWLRIQAELPDLPMGVRGGKEVLLPYAGAQTAPARNTENPELYAIYPFRLFGLGRAGLQLALDTFAARKNRQIGCWSQDPIQAAMLGLADLAQRDVTFNLTRKDPDLKFPAFWVQGNDYMPDEDNGGNGENGLQEMLLQTNGRQILLLPAWPKNWDADFKLNAPFQTTVTGKISQGRLVSLVVTPAARKEDVVLPADETIP